MNITVVLMMLLTVVVAVPLPAQALVIDFETLADSEPVTTQFPGLTFSFTTALTAGITLNEFEFPPHSGVNVVFDDGGAITIAFTAPIFAVGGFFTYLTPLTLTAFDAAFNPVAVDVSDFSSNLALSGALGSSPNELLQVASAGGISSVVIQGDPLGGSFTLDDLTLDNLAVPAPVALLLVATGFAAAVGWTGVRRGRTSRQRH